MPYDQDGNFVYPVPQTKSKAKAGGKRTGAESKAKTSAPVQVAPEPSIPAKTTSIEKTEEPPKPSHEKPVKSKAVTLDLEVFSELDLAKFWNAQNWDEGVPLWTTNGQLIRVVYRGRWSGGTGPDFKGAIIDFEGEIKRGDIELHLRSSQWREHHHQFNPQYNNTVLHVVLQHDAPTTTADGKQPPILALDTVLGAKLVEALQKAQASDLGSVSENQGVCCEQVGERNPDLYHVLATLDRQGEERFLEKAARYESECSFYAEEEAAMQAFWEGFLEALGYSQNKQPFRQLAVNLPLKLTIELDLACRRRAENPAERLLTLEAAIFGTAGLLPSQTKSKPNLKANPQLPLDVLITDETPPDWSAQTYIDELEHRWQWVKRELYHQSPDYKEMEAKAWTTGRVRPLNHPARRVAGLARWFIQLSPQSPLDLANVLTVNVPNLVDYFQVAVKLIPTDPKLTAGSNLFWAHHYQIGLETLPQPTKNSTPPDLIGADRAADTVINVVLPFLHGYAQYYNHPELAEKTFAAYRQQPRLASNELIENMAQQIFGHWWHNLPTEFCDKKGKPALSRLIPTAMRQQGLIHQHHRYCAEQNFLYCPFN